MIAKDPSIKGIQVNLEEAGVSNRMNYFVTFITLSANLKNFEFSTATD